MKTACVAIATFLLAIVAGLVLEWLWPIDGYNRNVLVSSFVATMYVTTGYRFGRDSP